MSPKAVGPRARHLAALAVAAILLGGCGDSGEQGSEARTAASPSRAKARTPPGTSLANARQIRVLRENFPPPRADTAAGREVIAAGRDACNDKTPLEIREEFYPQAEGALDSAQKEMIAKLPSFEDKAFRDYSFAAGQLAALVYEKSLAAAQGPYGFQGCVYELARGLEGELGGR